jgi:hypothetical protein
MRGRLLPLTILGGLLVAAGCSGGPKIVKVSGIATHKGVPVPSLRINFQPEKGRPSWGDTDANGRFTLEYDADNKGAIVGTHVVSAAHQPGSPDEEMGLVKPHPAVKAVTAKYSDMWKSPLKVEITGPIENLELKFD